MKPCMIWTLKKEEKQIVLKGSPNPDRFWIEVYSSSKTIPVEISEIISCWEDVGALLEKYRWTEYETVTVDPSFSKLVSELRIVTKTYKKPSSRERILELYDRFKNNELIDLKRVSFEFGVGTAEVKRDIQILRAFFNRENLGIVYDRKDKIYRKTELLEIDFDDVV
jgi:transcriptional antiterminator